MFYCFKDKERCPSISSFLRKANKKRREENYSFLSFFRSIKTDGLSFFFYPGIADISILLEENKHAGIFLFYWMKRQYDETRSY
jgi:hypothetical protein